MKLTIVAAIAALLVTTTAHANPTLPREFQGAWCGVEQEAMVFARQANCQASSGLDITPTRLEFHEATCTVAYVKPTKNGRYHLTFACNDDTDETSKVAIEHYWMRVYNGSLYMQRVDSTFTKPQGASLATTAAQAKAPELPKRFHGEWCENGWHDILPYSPDNCPGGVDLTITAKGFEGYEMGCTLRRLTPQRPSRRVDEYLATFRCESGEGGRHSVWHAYYNIGFYGEDPQMFMLEMNSTFTAAK